MVKIFLFSLRYRYHVVNINLYLVMDHVMEQIYHSTLICHSGVLQTERHNLVTESASLCDKSSLLCVFRFHLDLIIPRETTHEGKYLVLSGVVN